MAISTQTDQTEQKEIPRMGPAAKAEAAPSPAVISPVKENAPNDRRGSIFGPGVIIEGKIEGDADLSIAGTFKGDIQISGDVTIEKGAHLSAKINAVTVNIAGELEGNVASSQVRLLESGQLIGDLKATTLTVAAGSRMRGHVEFGWNPSEPAKFNGGDTQGSTKPKISR